ncbi:YoaK family protein [Oceanobacter kriegii]|uniref:YoaK family protein n=1 Tax=Oceanobacter kriegii TaxID=64972 RepID=UPI0006880BCA|nr:YoaK family protein [Oceanobacter kriegii]
MITRLPRWAECGAFLLAFIAGYINVVGLLGFDHQSISHLSGTASQLASSISEAQPHGWHLLGVLLSFLVGAVISGAVLGSSALQPGKPYELLLLLEGGLLLLSICLLQQQSGWGHFSASMACGLQNALATTFSGAIIRTTHVTGIVTDLGIMLGHWFRSGQLDKRKTRLFVLILAGFISGGILATRLFDHWQFNALLVPASLCLLAALAYRFSLKKPFKKTDQETANQEGPSKERPSR